MCSAFFQNKDLKKQSDAQLNTKKDTSEKEEVVQNQPETLILPPIEHHHDDSKDTHQEKEELYEEHDEEKQLELHSSKVEQNTTNLSSETSVPPTTDYTSNPNNVQNEHNGENVFRYSRTNCFFTRK